MKLKQIREYQSMKMGDLPQDFDLPDFTIITGLNGAGKSHFLKAIFSRVITIENEQGVMLTNNIDSLFRAFDFVQRDQGPFFNKNYQDKQTKAYEKLKNYLNLKKSNKEMTLEKYFHNRTGNNPDNILNILARRIIEKVANFWEVPIDELKQQHFDEYVSLPDNENNHGFINETLSISQIYHINYRLNKYRKFRVNEGEKLIVPAFTDKEFEEHFGPPPWEIFNKALNKFNSNYEITYPDLTSNPDYTFIPELKSTKKDALMISFNALSDGEKVLLALVVAYFNIFQYGIRPNDVLLLDEVDAPLHPSNIKKFLEVIEEVFLKKGVKIIMATHNPSTVAFAKEESLFVMREDAPRIEKVSKKQALDILTEGYVSLTEADSYLALNYNIEGKPSVLFVEGISDAMILKTAWKMLYEKDECPVYIQPAFDAGFMRNLFNRGEIYENNPEMITSFLLFDFDNAYNDWEGLEKKKFKDYKIDDPYKGLVKKHEAKDSYALLLPVPDNDDIKKQVISPEQNNFYGTFGDKSYLPIELLFYEADKLKDHFKQEHVSGGGAQIKFKGNKTTFAKDIENNIDGLEKDDFINFEPIFEFIRKHCKQ